jgi:hypothetical protein
MKFPASHPLLAALACWLTAACAASGPFPSLAPRAVEKEAEAAPEPPPPTVADAAVTARIAQLLTGARQANAQFEEAYRAADQATGRAGGVGSEGWIAAQQALSRAVAARGPVVDAIAELDRLGITHAYHPANLTAGQEALVEAQGIAERQLSLISSLQRRLA